MPTKRTRHMITETDAVAEALADAAARWPGLTASELLHKLLEEGHAALRGSAATDRRAVEQTSGALTGVYQPGERDALRDEWPA